MLLIPFAITSGVVYVGLRAVSQWRPKKSRLVEKVETSLVPAIDHEAEAQAKEAELNHYFQVSTATVALSVATAVFYPPLALLTAAGLAYSAIPFVKGAYAAWTKERKLNVNFIDILLFGGVIVTQRFFTGAVSVWIFLFSEKLLMKTQDNSQKKLVSVFNEQPRKVWLQQGQVEIEIPIERLQIGDVVVVNTGETVAVDGVVVEGLALLDQHILTGESKPVEKSPGDKVFATTVVLAGRVLIQVEQTGEQTISAQIGKIFSQTADFKYAVENRGQEIADGYVLPTLALGAAAWPFFGTGASLAILISTFAYNLRVIAPISVLNFLQVLSQHGILLKDGRALELLSQIDTIIFDKTGTLTLDQLTLGQIYLFNGITEDDLLAYAAASEQRQSHPIAKAIINAAQTRDLILPDIDETSYQVGYGIKAKLLPSSTTPEKAIQIGSLRFMELMGVSLPPEITQIQMNTHEEGHSLVCIAVDGHLVGALELQPIVRPEAKEMIKQLHQRNIKVYIISGDHETPTKTLAQELGVDHYFAETLPENKGLLVDKLRQEGRFVCFVGDGINDSIALKKANLSISLSGATMVATDTAQVVLMDGSLKQLNQLLDIGHEFHRNMQGNMASTVLPGAICMGGVIFGTMSFMGGVVLYCGGLGLGVVNAMLPLLKHHDENTHYFKNVTQTLVQTITE